MNIKIRVVIAAVVLAIAAQGVIALADPGGFSAEIQLDKRDFLIDDIVTGKMVICNSGHSASTRFSLIRIKYTISGPDGEMVAFDEEDPGILRLRYRETVLRPGDCVYRPICIGRNDKVFLLSDEGAYQISALIMLRPKDGPGGMIETRAGAVEFSVRDVGPVPDAYIHALSPAPTIRGAFRYGLAMNPEDIWNLELGPYMESLGAFMMYQGWHFSPRGLLTNRSKGAENMFERRVAIYRKRTGLENPRGYWIYLKIQEMKARWAGKDARNLGILGAGDISFD